MHRLYEGSFILFPLILRVYVSTLSCIMNICIGLMMLFQALMLKVLGGLLKEIKDSIAWIIPYLKQAISGDRSTVYGYIIYRMETE